jgi:hypothetical protein
MNTMKISGSESCEWMKIIYIVRWTFLALEWIVMQVNLRIWCQYKWQSLAVGRYLSHAIKCFIYTYIYHILYK